LSPICSRISAMACSVAPSPSIRVTGSPGDSSMIEKMIRDIPSITGIIINVRFAIYFNIAVSYIRCAAAGYCHA